MPKLFKKHPEGMLVALAVVFSVLMLGYFVFGVMNAMYGIAGVFNINKSGTENTSFNLSDAAKLDLRGLAQ